MTVKSTWYENDGNGNFGSQQIITTAADGAWSVHAADLDGDGDLDVLSASRNDNKIAWYENDGRWQFPPQQVMTTEATSAADVYATDRPMATWTCFLLLMVAFLGTKTTVVVNFGEPQARVSTGADDNHRAVYATDIDGDGDMDVLLADDQMGKIAWYENFSNDLPPTTTTT